MKSWNLGEPSMINAKITGTNLGVEDHGMLTFFLYLDYGGMGQGAGGYSLHHYKELNYNNYVSLLILAILKVAGVDKWEDLKGAHIRCVANNAKVISIHHILKDNINLDFTKFWTEPKHRAEVFEMVKN